MRALTLAAKDLRQVLRDRRSAIAFIVMPILFTTLTGLAYRPGEPDDQPLRVGLIVEDDGWLARQFELALQGSRLIAPMRVASVAEADALVAEGRLAAAVLVPRGFTARLSAHEPPKLTVLAQPASWAGQLAQQGLSSALLRISSATEAAHRALGVTHVEGADREASWTTATARALGQWLDAGVQLEVERPSAEGQLGSSGAESGAEVAPSPALTRASPGMIVMFAILGLIRSAMVPVLERRQRTFQRMLTTGASQATIITGHLLGVFASVFGQCVILVTAGQLAFGLDYLRAPLATVAMLGALSFWIASLGMFIAAFAKGPEQVVLFAFVAMIVFSALGGAWFPLEVAGGAFMAAGRVTPAAWAMQGFQTILGSGAVLEPVAQSVLVLLGYSIAFLVPAMLQAAAVE